MKKIFTYLAVAALMAVACDDMYGPVETPTTPDKAGSDRFVWMHSLLSKFAQKREQTRQEFGLAR